MDTNIKIDLIAPSPYQHRRRFHVDELSESIKRDGLIEPIVVREVVGGYELIAGERRLRAVKLFDTEILARIVEATDLQARRMCATENMQRDDVSASEEVDSLIDLIDAELVENKEYFAFADTPQLRVKFLLGKLNADYNHKTEHFVHKFMHNVEAIFSALPRKKKWQSFLINDLPLLSIPDVVLDIAADNRLNKSQTKALSDLQKKAPESFDALLSKADKDGKIVSGSDDDGEAMSLESISAKEINTIGEQERYSNIAKRIRDLDITKQRDINELNKRDVKIGDVYQIGRHKLYVGDVNNFINEIKCDCVMTDPPYGISYKAPSGSGLTIRGDYDVIENDDVEFNPDLLFKFSENIITWGGNHYANKLPNSAGWIVWDKREGEQINNNSDCEMAWSNMLGSARLFHHTWNGMIKASEKNETRIHPTQKPIKLFVYCLEITRAGKIILDPYAGSGTTLIACEETNRDAILVEIDPVYASAILNRFDYLGVEKL